MPRQAVLGTTVATLVITLLTWPIRTLTAPIVGTEGSWEAGLHMAARLGLPFGTRLDFTYGPLGYLGVPHLFFLRSSVPAVLYAVAVHASLVAIVVHLTARRIGYRWAVLVSFAVVSVSLVEPAELVPIVFFLACMACLSTSASDRMSALVVYVGSGVTALQLLVKFNTGIVMFALAAIFAATVPRRRVRMLAVHVVGTVALTLLLWVSAGQPVSTLATWLRHSIDLVARYSSEMALEDPRRWFEYPVAFALLTWLVILASRETQRRTAKSALGLWGLIVVIVGYGWKRGFVRHEGFPDVIHSVSFFLSLALLPLALTWLAKSRRTLIATTLVGLIVVEIVLPIEVRPDLLRPATSFSQIRTLVTPERPAEMIAKLKQDIRSVFRIDEATLAVLEGRTVHIDPYHTIIAWAYDLDWDPVPVFQSYSAYTPRLDRLNAWALAAPTGPERILRDHPDQVNDRYPMFESPEYMLTLICRYREVSATRAYEVLARSADRCGSQRPLTSPVDASSDVLVPKAGPEEIVFMRITIVESLISRLRSIIYKPESPPIIRLVTGNVSNTYQLVQGTAGGPLILCVPASAGFSADFVETRCPETVRVTRRSSASVSFYAVKITAAGA